MARYRVSREAIRDLDHIWYSLAKDSEAAAARLLDRFYEVFVTLARQPRMGRERSDIAPQIRSFVVDDYLIFYEVDSSGVRIARVWDGRQDPERLKREL
jgi:toxin ParE1/3/4